MANREPNMGPNKGMTKRCRRITKPTAIIMASQAQAREERFAAAAPPSSHAPRSSTSRCLIGNQAHSQAMPQTGVHSGQTPRPEVFRNHKKRAIARFETEQAQRRLDIVTPVVAARENCVRLETLRQKEMQALIRRHSQDDLPLDRRSTLEHRPSEGLLANLGRSRDGGSVVPHSGWRRPDGGDDEDVAADCDSCADEAFVMGGDARMPSKRPRGETAAVSMTRPARLQKLECVQDTASGPSDHTGQPGHSHAPSHTRSQSPINYDPDAAAARVVACECSSELDIKEQRVDLGLFGNVDLLYVGLERLFPGCFSRHSMHLCYMDDDQDCLLVSRHTPWRYMQTSITRLMLISNP